MQTLLGAQLLSDLTLARIRAPQQFPFPSQPVNQSLLRGARPFIYRATALVASGLAYQGRFCLNLASGFNTNLALRYVQFFDQPGLPAPGDIAIQSIAVSPTSEFSWSPPQDGLIFERACVFALSTTPVVFTAGAAELYMRMEGFVP